MRGHFHRLVEAVGAGSLSIRTTALGATSPMTRAVGYRPAKHGFAVEAVDGAATGLDFARREAAARELRLSLHQADADALPFADESFDYVLSWNVIFHGTMGDVGRRLAEIWRILKPGALYQGTMLSKRDAQFRRGRPVAPDTFIRGSDAKAHPHYYCDLAGLAALFAGFELLSLTQEEQRRPGSWHWHILAERC
jgi:tellurite methyltransferase